MSDFTADYLTAVRDAIKPAFVHHKQAMVKDDILVWAYSLRLHQVEPQAAAQAILYWLATQRFFPQPIDITELAKGETAGNRGLQALQVLKALIQNVGPYFASPNIKDPVLRQTVEDFGGWRAICEDFTDDDFFRNRFLKAYANNQKATPVVGLSNQVTALGNNAAAGDLLTIEGQGRQEGDLLTMEGSRP